MESIDSFCKQFNGTLAVKVHIRDKHEFISLVNENDSLQTAVCKIYFSDLGVSAVDFYYDAFFDQIVSSLLESEEVIKRLKKAPENLELWNELSSLANTLAQNDSLHPYYFLVLSTIVNLYKRKMRDHSGQLVHDRILVDIGLSFVHLREEIDSYFGLSKQKCSEYTAGAQCLDKLLPPKCVRTVHLEYVPASTKGSNVNRYIPAYVLRPELPADIWNYLLPHYFDADLVLRRCENCSGFFITTGAGNPKYCDRFVKDSKKTCRLLMAKEKAHIKNTTNPINVFFNRTYKTMYSRVGAGKLEKHKFNVWAQDAREVRDSCETGIISLTEFCEWLEESRNNPKYK